MPIKNSLWIFALLAAFALLISCGTVRTERTTEFRSSESGFPAYSGPTEKVQVIQFSIPEAIVAQYPELKTARVGWGLYNRLVDGLYETGRFALLEEKDTIQKKIVSTWEMSESGLAATDEVVESAGLKVARYLIYAEVFEFSVSKSSTAVALASKDEVTTIVGVQFRVVDTRDGSYIPASGIGEATTSREGVWAPALEFDQSTVGVATQMAVTNALQSVLRRLK